MPPYPLTNFEIQKCYQNEPNRNGVYSRDNLHKIKDGTYMINLEYESIETHWIAVYMNGGNATYFDSFGVEHIKKKEIFIGSKNIITNIYGMQSYHSTM